MTWFKPFGWIALLGLPLLALLAAAVLAPGAALNALSAVGSLRVARGQAYGPLPRQHLDLYRPAGVAPAGGWPLVLFFHGGSWRRGDTDDYRFVGEALAARGMVVAVAGYRLYPQVRYPGFLEDAAAALAQVRAQARAWGADPARLFVMGHSAGAYNAAMLALDARWQAGAAGPDAPPLAGAAGPATPPLAGWIGLAGPYDFLPIGNPEVQPVFGHPQVPADSQPLHHARAAPPLPAFLGAAQDDGFVNPQRNTRALAAALAAAGAPVVLREYARVNHLTLLGALAAPLRPLAPVLDEVADFVQRHRAHG